MKVLMDLRLKCLSTPSIPFCTSRPAAHYKNSGPWIRVLGSQWGCGLPNATRHGRWRSDFREWTVLPWVG